MSDDLALLGITQLAALIRRRKVSSVEATRACLHRIADWQPAINAFIEVEADDALRAARQRDRERARGLVRGPLHGVPMAHKDVFYRRGKVCSAGSEIRRHWVAPHTATVIDRLESAGAVTLGRLGMAEFAADPTGHNAHFGPCRNPWNPAFIPGASSSGSGAALAARLVHGALGSDTGGSIRLPAAACGVVGLMPTQGRVSRYGAIPRAWTLDRVGPMARTAADCARLMRVIAGFDPNDGMALQETVPNYERALRRDLRGMTIGILAELPDAAVSDEVRAILDASLAVLRSLGAKIKRVVAPDTLTLFRMNDLILKAEAAAIHGNWLRERPQDYAPYLRVRIEGGLLVPATRYIEALALRGPLLAAFLHASFNGVDLLHCPVIAQPLPTLDAVTLDADRPETLARAGRLSTYTRLFNYLGVPAVSVPGGFDRNGLPVGFQLIGRPFDEPLLLAAAHAYQMQTDWHERTPRLAVDPPATADPPRRRAHPGQPKTRSGA